MWTLVSVLFPGLSLSVSEQLFRVTNLSPLLYSLAALSVGGLLAFGLGFSEFLLVSRTSSLTLSISGIFKVLYKCVWYDLLFETVSQTKANKARAPDTAEFDMGAMGGVSKANKYIFKGLIIWVNFNLLGHVLKG